MAPAGFRPAGATVKRSQPVSRVLSKATIPLGLASPQASGSLPGRRAGRALRRLSSSRPSLFGLAPDGVCHAASGCPSRGALLPHHFTLASVLRRFGGLLSVALSVGSRRREVISRPARWSPDFPPHPLVLKEGVQRLLGQLRGGV